MKLFVLFSLSLFWWDRSSGELTPVPLEGILTFLGHRADDTILWGVTYRSHELAVLQLLDRISCLIPYRKFQQKVPLGRFPISNYVVNALQRPSFM
jgi:hypothetical protein